MNNQKALSSEVSRKGGSVKPMSAPADKPWLSTRETSEKKYGASKMSGEQVDKLVSEFVKTRRR